jgi:hypothetical protein
MEESTYCPTALLVRDSVDDARSVGGRLRQRVNIRRAYAVIRTMATLLHVARPMFAKGRADGHLLLIPEAVDDRR